MLRVADFQEILSFPCFSVNPEQNLSPIPLFEFSRDYGKAKLSVVLHHGEGKLCPVVIPNIPEKSRHSKVSVRRTLKILWPVAIQECHMKSFGQAFPPPSRFLLKVQAGTSCLRMGRCYCV